MAKNLNQESVGGMRLSLGGETEGFSWGGKKAKRRKLTNQMEVFYYYFFLIFFFFFFFSLFLS